MATLKLGSTTAITESSGTLTPGSFTGGSFTNSTLVTPTVASMANCTFPAGHVIQTRVTTIMLTDDDSNDCATNATAGIAIQNGTSLLQITGFSMTAGNLLKVDYSAGMIDGGNGDTNGMWGVKVDSQMHMTNFKQAQDKQTCTTNWAKVMSGGLSNVTIAAWMAATGGNTMGVYCHEYTGNGHDSLWSITAQEIQM